MSIPKNGRFHRCNAYVSTVYDYDEWHKNNLSCYREGAKSSVRLVPYQSSVVDYNETTRTITLYPRWEYSVTTIRQVCRFIHECTGTWYGVDDLRMFRKIQERNGTCDRNTLGDLFVFSKEYPNG